MKRIRVAGIIIKDKKILLMERKKEGEHYWVFPGGGVKKHEKLNTALIREIAEETNAFIKPLEFKYARLYKDQEEYYFNCRFIKGILKLRENSIEQKRIKDGQFYKPAWVPVNDLHKYNLLPLPIRDVVIKNFSPN